MSKFKVGDKVRILDGSKIKDYAGGWNGIMAKRVGEVYAISKVYDDYPDGRVSYRLDIPNIPNIPTLRYEFIWDERGLEAACKFKVGDKVRAKKDTPYLYTIDGWIGKVTNVYEGYITAVDILGHIFTHLNEKYFDLVEDKQKIVITTDGKMTTAVLYNGKQRIKEAKAVCAPDDEFDFNKGAAIAFERLTGQACGKRADAVYIDKFEQLLNTKICITHGDSTFKTGHIYEIKDGHFIRLDGYMSLPDNGKLRNIADLKYYFSSWDNKEKFPHSGGLSHWSMDAVEFIEVIDD